jgi:hypothetical protein
MIPWPVGLYFTGLSRFIPNFSNALVMTQRCTSFGPSAIRHSLAAR